jgi:hypothetical protein
MVINIKHGTGRKAISKMNFSDKKSFENILEFIQKP